MSVLHSGFPPISDSCSRTLVLGTFPSPLSREKNEYYGNPRNQFWRIMQEVFDEPFTTADYEKKKALLYANGIAVWDVIAKCEADGALDSTIRNPMYNTDLPMFISENGITRVFFNGINAFTFYKRGIGSIDRNVLPSTSPANARMNLDKKAQIWRNALRG